MMGKVVSEIEERIQSNISILENLLDCKQAVEDESRCDLLRD